MNVIPLLLLYLWLCAIRCQLIINVKNKGGDVFKESIEANTTQDTISLDFMSAEGTLVTHFVDAKNKNPSAIRHPEEQSPVNTYGMDALLNVRASHLLSPHISTVCRHAEYSTFAREADLKLLTQILNKNYSLIEKSIKKLPEVNGISACSQTFVESSPCACHYVVCIEWYPCGLKYCRGRDSLNRVLNYRCGIKTCRKCRTFKCHVISPLLCSWDEPNLKIST